MVPASHLWSKEAVSLQSVSPVKGLDHENLLGCSSLDFICHTRPRSGLYVLADPESGKCEISIERPDASAASRGASVKTMGVYEDTAAAEKAMAGMKECEK